MTETFEFQFDATDFSSALNALRMDMIGIVNSESDFPIERLFEYFRLKDARFERRIRRRGIFEHQPDKTYENSARPIQVVLQNIDPLLQELEISIPRSVVVAPEIEEHRLLHLRFLGGAADRISIDFFDQLPPEVESEIGSRFTLQRISFSEIFVRYEWKPVNVKSDKALIFFLRLNEESRRSEVEHEADSRIILPDNLLTNSILLSGGCGCGGFEAIKPVEGRRCITVHIKILLAPNMDLQNMQNQMAAVYQTVDFQVNFAAIENLNIPNLLDVNVGRCVQGQAMTQDQTALFNNRNGVGPNDIAVYFVRSTIPALNGCAAHPPGFAAAICTRTSSLWTLAHEVGHVLGLGHVNDNDRLMTGNGTANITNPPADLTADEQETMRRSRLSILC